jgi:hypothetical protein
VYAGLSQNFTIIYVKKVLNCFYDFRTYDPQGDTEIIKLIQVSFGEEEGSSL